MLQRTYRVPFLFLCAILMATSLPLEKAEAKDMRGKLGIGANTTLTGAHGLTIRYYPSRRFGVEILGGTTIGRDSSTGNKVNIAFAAQFNYVLREIGRANLLVGLRGVIAYVNDDNFNQSPSGEPQLSNSYIHPAIEAPLTIEYYFSDAFSLQLSAGLALSFVPEDGALLTGGRIFGEIHSANTTRNYQTVIGVGSGGLFGSAGFTFYF